MSKSSCRFLGSITVAVILLNVLACVYVPHITEADPGTPPQYRSVGPSNGTSLTEGENLTLYAQGYDDTALDWAWLSTNESGTWKNYTQLWSDWQASGSNPILDGDSTFGSGYMTEDSEVLKVNDTYYMFTSSGSTWSTMQIYMLSSSSLTGPWSIMNGGNPIIPRSASGWDQSLLRMGCVTHHDGTYYLYYMGSDASSVFSMGVATTSDADFPTGWSKYSGNPILERTGTGWESAGIYSMCISRIGPPGSEWYGVYTASDGQNAGGGYWSIGVCYSDSPYGPFTRHEDNPILQRGVGQWDNMGSPRSTFIKIDDRIYGAYEGATSPSTADYQVGGYTGEITDSILNATFSKDSDNPIIAGSAGSGDKCANPYWWYENGTRYLIIGGGISPQRWRYIDLFSSSDAREHDSPLNTKNAAGSWIWSNFTWFNSSLKSGTTIQWKIYYNDTEGNVNATETHSFTMTTPEYDYVDLDTSDLDGNGDKGTHSNFDNEKACDSSYDTLSEMTAGGFGIMTHRKNITIDHNYVQGDLTNFPVLVDIYNTDLHDDVQASGNDIAFTDSSGNRLNHEIEYFSKNYNGTHAHLIAWVSTNLTSTSDTTICMIYGNPICGSQQNPTAVWDSNYKGVWHLNASSSPDPDSSTNNQAAVWFNTPTQADAKIGKGKDFDASDGTKTAEDSDHTAASITVEGWICGDTFSNTETWNEATFFVRYYTYYFMISKDAANRGKPKVYLYTSGTSAWKLANTALDVGSWHYLAFTYTSGSLKIYINGTLDTEYTDVTGNVQAGGGAGSQFIYFGSHDTGSPFRTLDGKLDEMRLSSGTRSPEWLNATYQNVVNLADFLSVGSEESKPTNYELDLEIQWTNVNFTRTGEELCIKTGVFSGSEDIQVRIWNSTDNSWYWIMNLSANQWNNVSVSSYLTESTFTIQFLGGTETEDTIQDSWNIDCSLLHTWEQTELYIDPPLIERISDDVGTTFQINVTIQNVRDLRGFDFNLTWGNTLITLVSTDFNTTLDNMWGPGNWFVDETTMNVTDIGSYELAAVSTATGFASAGAAPLVTLTFQVEDYAGETTIHFAMVKLSNSQWQNITVETTDGKYNMTMTPGIEIMPTTVTCRKYSEQFELKINLTHVVGVHDFHFEMTYNTTLVDYVSIEWGELGPGTATANETIGLIEGQIVPTDPNKEVNGNPWLFNVTFRSSYNHMWKDESTIPGWKNDLSDAILFQSANLSYAGGETLHYVKGGINEISVGPDVAYMFSPIQGDVDNSGEVEIFDLRTVAAFYDTANPQYNLTGDDTIDIFDIVVIGANFGYSYNP